jgi:hypothetical protein
VGALKDSCADEKARGRWAILTGSTTKKEQRLFLSLLSD